MTFRRTTIPQAQIWSLINGLDSSLAAVAEQFPAWLASWREKHQGERAEHKWDHFRSEFITQGPDWEALMADPNCDVLRIMLDRCLERLWGCPGCISVVRLRWAVKILRLRPDLARGDIGDGSLLIRTQGLLNPEAIPDGVPAKVWRGLLARSLRILIAIPEMELEFRRCLRIMENSTQHPLRDGFFRAVAEGTKLIHGKEFCRKKLRRLNHIRVSGHLERMREEGRNAVAA